MLYFGLQEKTCGCIVESFLLLSLVDKYLCVAGAGESESPNNKQTCTNFGFVTTYRAERREMVYVELLTLIEVLVKYNTNEIEINYLNILLICLLEIYTKFKSKKQRRKNINIIMNELYTKSQRSSKIHVHGTNIGSLREDVTIWSRKDIVKL